MREERGERREGRREEKRREGREKGREEGEYIHHTTIVQSTHIIRARKSKIELPHIKVGRVKLVAGVIQ